MTFLLLLKSLIKIVKPSHLLTITKGLSLKSKELFKGCTWSEEKFRLIGKEYELIKISYKILDNL